MYNVFIFRRDKKQLQYTRCDSVDFSNSAPATGRTKSNRLDFMRQVAATKFRRGDNIFHQKYLAHTGRICREDKSLQHFYTFTLNWVTNASFVKLYSGTEMTNEDFADRQ